MNLNLFTTMEWLVVAFVLGGGLLLGAGLAALLVVNSLAQAADSFVAMFHSPIRPRNARPLDHLWL